MEGEIIIVSVISTIGGLFGLWLVNQNWYKRQEFKYKYMLKRQKLSQKGKIPKSSVPDKPSGLSTVANLLPLLKTLDPDQIGALVDKFTGDQDVAPSGGGGLDFLMEFAESNPEMVQSFLKGIGEKKENESQEEEEEFKSQVS